MKIWRHRGRQLKGRRLAIALLAVLTGPQAAFCQGDPGGELGDRIRDALESRALKLTANPGSRVPGTEERTVSHLGISRHYLLHLPNGRVDDKPLPLIIALHGAFTNGNITEELTGLSALAYQGQFAVAYPNANPDGGTGLWEFWAPPVPEPGQGEAGRRRYSHGRDDVGFIAALIDRLEEEGIADPRRVYLTGISNGAFMINRLSIDLGGRIAAIAPVAGTTLKIGAILAVPRRAMPVLYFHGTEDKIVQTDGIDLFSKGDHSLSDEEFAAWWVGKNGCAAEPVTAALPDRDRDDGCTVERLTWAAGSKAAPVVYYRITGGGHSWPGGSESQPEEILGKVCRDIDASRLIWEFFSGQVLPAKP